jgi:hypothetical protein
MPIHKCCRILRRPRGLILLLSAASLSVMAALGLAMLGTPATLQTQTHQLNTGDQARQNAESGYYFALSSLRAGGMVGLRNHDNATFGLGSGSFQISVVDRPRFNFTVRTDQTIAPGGDLTGISLPDGETLPRLDGRFIYDGVEYRYASFEADAGVMVGVQRVDGAAGTISIFSNGVVEGPPRTDIVSVGTFGGIQQTFTRQVEVLPSQGCPLPWGGRVPVDQWVLAYEEASPACGTSCTTEIRTCQVVGLRPVDSSLVFEQVVQLSGSYTQRLCSAQSCDCSTPWGTAVRDGSSVVAYETSVGVPGLLCQGRREIRYCTGGNLSGSFRFASCSDPEPASCRTPLGASVAHGASVVLYEHETPPQGQACSSQIRTCTDGFLSGWYFYDQCSVPEQLACTTPWGSSAASGSSVIAYQSASVPHGETCQAETRACSNGVLAGSFLNQSCSVQSAPPPADPVSTSCTTPWGETVEEGDSVVAYREPTVSTGTCSALSLLCTQGELVSHSSRLRRAMDSTGIRYDYPSCTVETPVCNQTLGDPVLDLGPGKGKLIHPFRSQDQNSGAWYYVWDIDGSGTHNTGSDYTRDRIGKCDLPWDAEQLVNANGIRFRMPTVDQIQRDIRVAPAGWNTTESYWTGSLGRRTETNGDGFIRFRWTWRDAELAANCAAGIQTCNARQIRELDITGDGALSSTDAALIMQQIVGNGDVDGDGVLTWRDADLVAQCSVQAEICNAHQLQVGDVTGNGDLSALDVSEIMQRILGNGDIDGDGVLTSRDADLVAACSTGLQTCNDLQIAVGDLTGNRQLSAFDSSQILQRIAAQSWTREYLKGYSFIGDGVEFYDEVTSPWASEVLRLSRFVAVHVEEVTCNVPGNSVIDFSPARGWLSSGGAYNPTRGKLIHPIQVEGRWFYAWDVDGSGTHNTAADFSGDRLPASFGLRDSVVHGSDPGAYGCAVGGVCVRYPDERQMNAIRNACISSGEPGCYSPAGAHAYQDITPLPVGWASLEHYWKRPLGSFSMLSGISEDFDTVSFPGSDQPWMQDFYTVLEVTEGGVFGPWGSVNHTWRDADRGVCR